MPIITRLGIDPVHFGLVMMTCVTLGGMTPPVGVAMFAVCGILKCPMDEYTLEAPADASRGHRAGCFDDRLANQCVISAKLGVRWHLILSGVPA